VEIIDFLSKNKINTNGFDYSINILYENQNPELLRNEITVGTTNFLQSKIYLVDRPDKINMFFTFLHELAHIFLFENPQIKLDGKCPEELFCDAFASFMKIFLTQNGFVK